jgi:hypothetical protein
MYLARYRFDGNPDALEAAHRQLLAGFPTDLLDLHIAVRRADGLDVYDSCPGEADFHAFSVSAEFNAALSNAGLPAPRVEGIGEIVAASLKQPVG